jgi:hypothetical protein
VRSYNSQIRVERILIFSPHNLVKIVGRGESGRDVVIFLKDGNIGVALLRKMKSRREAESAASDDYDRVGLGYAHDGVRRKVKLSDSASFLPVLSYIPR